MEKRCISRTVYLICICCVVAVIFGGLYFFRNNQNTTNAVEAVSGNVYAKSSAGEICSLPDITITTNNGNYNYRPSNVIPDTFEFRDKYRKYGRGESLAMLETNVKELENAGIEKYMALCYMMPGLYDVFVRVESENRDAKNASFEFTGNYKNAFSYTSDVSAKVLDKNALATAIIDSIVQRANELMAKSCSDIPYGKKQQLQNELNSNNWYANDGENEIIEQYKKNQSQSADNQYNIIGCEKNQSKNCSSGSDDMGEIVVSAPFIFTAAELGESTLREQTAYRGGATTSIASSTADRRHNVAQSIGNFHKMIVPAGETISFNEVVGRRTEDNGYRNAKIIVDGEYVDGVGGGVCQSSTTLYNAVLRAGLTVLTSRAHSQQVSYVPAGLDAMVNFGTSDLQWRNNTNSDIFITAHTTSENVSVMIYGEKLPSGISYQPVSEITQTIPPAEALITYDDTMYEDEEEVTMWAKNGVVVSTYLVTNQGEKIVNKQWLRTDKYPPRAEEKTVGTKKREIYFFPFSQNFFNR